MSSSSCRFSRDNWQSYRPDSTAETRSTQSFLPNFVRPYIFLSVLCVSAVNWFLPKSVFLKSLKVESAWGMTQFAPTDPTDLKYSEWLLIAQFVLPKSRGHPRKWEMWQILNAILSVTRWGSAWGRRPKDMPPWQTVYGYLGRWAESGLVRDQPSYTFFIQFLCYPPCRTSESAVKYRPLVPLIAL